MEERELLHTDGLSVGYHGKELIKEIGISLKRGEIVTLIGPNGAGKSTILKTIAKQLQEIRGSVYVENINLSELPEKELAKKMSIVFTERITPELMTVADVVAMGRYPYTGGLGILTPKDEAVVAQCMDQVDLRRPHVLLPQCTHHQLLRLTGDLRDLPFRNVHGPLLSPKKMYLHRCMYNHYTVSAPLVNGCSPFSFTGRSMKVFSAKSHFAGQLPSICRSVHPIGAKLPF